MIELQWQNKKLEEWEPTSKRSERLLNSDALSSRNMMMLGNIRMVDLDYIEGLVL
jgi:hypothetical protein